jgi:hypothetical protein
MVVSSNAWSCFCVLFFFLLLFCGRCEKNRKEHEEEDEEEGHVYTLVDLKHGEGQRGYAVKGTSRAGHWPGSTDGS